MKETTVTIDRTFGPLPEVPTDCEHFPDDIRAEIASSHQDADDIVTARRAYQDVADRLEASDPIIHDIAELARQATKLRATAIATEDMPRQRIERIYSLIDAWVAVHHSQDQTERQRAFDVARGASLAGTEFCGMLAKEDVQPSAGSLGSMMAEKARGEYEYRQQFVEQLLEFHPAVKAYRTKTEAIHAATRYRLTNRQENRREKAANDLRMRELRASLMPAK